MRVSCGGIVGKCVSRDSGQGCAACIHWYVALSDIVAAFLSALTPGTGTL